MSESNASDNWLLRDLPPALRQPIVLLLLLGALSGALTSLLGLISFFARLLFVQDAWSWVDALSIAFPQILRTIVQWIGFGFHQVVEAYRDTIYPAIYWVTQHINLQVPGWIVDVGFVALFSLVASLRVNDKGWVNGEGMNYWKDYGIYVPFLLVIGVGTAIVFVIDLIIRALSFGKIYRASTDLYYRLPHRIDDFVFAFMYVALVLSLLLCIDIGYRAYFAA